MMTTQHNATGPATFAPTARGPVFRTAAAITAIGAAINAGVFLSFSWMVMPGLDQQAQHDAAGAIRAMQAMNIVTVSSPFMVTLFGTCVACASLAVASLIRIRRRGSLPALIGALAFMVGSIGLTMGYHVPRNDALAGVTPDGMNPAQALAAWVTYSSGWTTWNTVRGLGSVVAAAGLGWAASKRRG